MAVGGCCGTQWRHTDFRFTYHQLHQAHSYYACLCLVQWQGEVGWWHLLRTSTIQNHFTSDFLRSHLFNFFKVFSVQLLFYYLWLEALCWIPSSPHSSLFDMYQHGTPIVLNGKLLKNPNLASHYACMRHLGVIYGQASQSLPSPRKT